MLICAYWGAFLTNLWKVKMMHFSRFSVGSTAVLPLHWDYCLWDKNSCLLFLVVFFLEHLLIFVSFFSRCFFLLKSFFKIKWCFQSFQKNVWKCCFGWHVKLMQKFLKVFQSLYCKKLFHMACKIDVKVFEVFFFFDAKSMESC